MAVDLWSEVTVSRSDKFEITAEGDGAEDIPKDESNFLVVGVKAAFETANKPVPTLKYHVVSRIPFARGLGSSSAAIVAGIIAGLVLAGHRLPCWGSEALLQIAADIEVRNYMRLQKLIGSQQLSHVFLSSTRAIRIMLLPLSTVVFNLVFTMDRVGSPSVSHALRVCSSSCLSPTLLAKPRPRAESWPIR